MVWAIDNDDFVPECSNVRYPLLKAINAEFNAADSGASTVTTDKVPVTSTTAKPGNQASNIHGNAFNLLFLLASVLFGFHHFN